MVWTSRPVRKIYGQLRAPADKSCSHRSLILGGLARGKSIITGLLEGDDVRNTGRVMMELGARLEHIGPGHWQITGVGDRGLQSPNIDLDFGNSGTGARLMMGVIAGYPIRAHLVGDTSLSARPMARVLDPLERMGATYTASAGGRMPLTLQGCAELKPITYTPPHASAQVLSLIHISEPTRPY